MKTKSLQNPCLSLKLVRIYHLSSMKWWLRYFSLWIKWIESSQLSLKREIGSDNINKRILGKEQENKAVDYLLSKGYTILEKNYLRRTGEIDIVVKSPDDYLVAVEVKYRSSDRFGSPFSAVNYTKQRKIYKTLLFYMSEHNIPMDAKCRFDVVGIYGDNRLEHLINAFEAC